MNRDSLHFIEHFFPTVEKQFMNHTNAGKNNYTWSNNDELTPCHSDIGSFQQLPSCEPESGLLQTYNVACKAPWAPWWEVLCSQMLMGNAGTPQHLGRSYSAGAAGDGGMAWDSAPALSTIPQDCTSHPTQMELRAMLLQFCMKGSPGDFLDTLTPFHLGAQCLLPVKTWNVEDFCQTWRLAKSWCSMVRHDTVVLFVMYVV